MNLKPKMCETIGRLFLCILSGILLVASFPPFRLYPLAWVALVPLLWAIRDTGIAEGALLGLLFGTVYLGGVLSWIGVFGVHAWIAFSLFYSTYLVLFALLCRLPVFRNQWWAVPFLWTSVEWLRTQGPMGITWGGIGYSQVQWLEAVQLASVTGVYGITFLIALVNASILEIGQKVREKGAWPRLLLSIPMATAIFLHVLGAILISGAASGGDWLKISAVQPNIDQSLKWDKRYFSETLRILKESTEEVSQDRPDFIVWPETAVPAYVLQEPMLLAGLSDLARQSKANLVFGAPDADSKQRLYNAVAAISREGSVIGFYRKIHLVPFGEYVPLDKWIGRWKILDRVGRFSPGKEMTVFEVDNVPFSTLICFESAFPDLARKAVNNRAKLLLILTNDAWFERSAAADQHFDFAVFRAVENRVYVAQIANTGISGFVDPAGRTLAKTGLFQRKTVSQMVRTQDRITLHRRFGDWFALLCVLATAVLAFARVHTESA